MKKTSVLGEILNLGANAHFALAQPIYDTRWKTPSRPLLLIELNTEGASRLRNYGHRAQFRTTSKTFYKAKVIESSIKAAKNC